jgi:DNA-directed RNA polymerase subunit RPC12/RpoP
MIVTEMKCGMCGRRFEAELLDREDSKERHVHGAPLRCPNCNSKMLERIRLIRRLTRRVS